MLNIQQTEHQNAVPVLHFHHTDSVIQNVGSNLKNTTLIFPLPLKNVWNLLNCLKNDLPSLAW